MAAIIDNNNISFAVAFGPRKIAIETITKMINGNKNFFK